VCTSVVVVGYVIGSLLRTNRIRNRQQLRYSTCRAWGVRFQEHPPIEAEIQMKSYFVLQVPLIIHRL